jgi:uncharacterized protein involved in exopolysaccharide biosynthesis
MGLHYNRALKDGDDMPRKPPAPEFDLEFDDAEGAERAGPQPKDWALLILRSALRRKVLFLAVLVACAAGVFAYYRLKRPVYRVEAKILAQRNLMLPSGLRGAPDDSATRTAWELIHRRENLIALLQAANLIEPRHPGAPEASPPGAAAGTEPDDSEDPRDRMVRRLDRMLVVIAEEGTITISLDWPDARQAYRIVDASIQNFIEARHVQEVTAIDEVISVLRVRSVKAKEQLDQVVDEVRRESIEGSREPVAALRPSGPRQPSEELVRLKTLLEGKERALEDVEEFRRRRLADLHAQLDERRTTYSDAHPSVIQLRQDIEALSKDSSQVQGLRDEEAKLRKDYQARLAQEGLGDAGRALPAAPVSAAARGAPRVRPNPTPVEEDERVREARFQYQQIEERVNAAQMELDAVRAAFKYRYNIIWPPQIPRDPVSPNPVKVFGAGLLASLFLAFLVAAAPDLRSGRIVERWQVERALGLPVLAEIDDR